MRTWVRERVNARWRLSALLVILVMAVGLVGSWALAVTVSKRERLHAHAVMDQRVRVIESAVAAEVRRYVETTADLAVAFGAQSDLSASDFTAVTSNLNRSRLPGVSSVSLVVPATDDEIPRLQRLWRARGAAQLSFAPAGTADEHLFSVLNLSFDGTAPQAGRDFSASMEPTQAMAASLARDQVTASLTYVPLEDRGLPSEQQQRFVLAAPVAGGPGTAHEGAFQGWLLIEVRGRDFVREALELASQNFVQVTLIDNSTPAAAVVPVAQVSHRHVVADAGLERKRDLQVAGRVWQLQVQPTTAFVSSLGPSLSAPAGGAGVLFTVLLAILVGTLSSSRSRALARVDSATAALRSDIAQRERVEAALLEREEELHRMVRTDSLTGLANRRAADERVEAWASDATDASQLTVVLCDVNALKKVNDTHGHLIGDQLIQQVGTYVAAAAARLPHGIAARIGGDEFLIATPCRDQVLVQDVVDELAAAAARLSYGDGLSCGSAWAGELIRPEASPQSLVRTLLRLADAQQYRRKISARAAAFTLEPLAQPESHQHRRARRNAPPSLTRRPPPSDDAAPIADVDGNDASLWLPQLSEHATVELRLQYAAQTVSTCAGAVAWWISTVDHPAGTLQAVSCGLTRTDGSTDGLWAPVELDPTIYRICDFPLTTRAVQGEAFSVDTRTGDPAEQRLLIQLGYQSMIAAGGTDDAGCGWLIEIYGDSLTTNLHTMTQTLHLATAVAMAITPHTTIRSNATVPV